MLSSAGDLARVGDEVRARRVPVLIAFTQAGCPYCAKVTGSYLLPLGTSPNWRNKVIMREVEIDSTEPLRDFAGCTTTRRDFARRHGVKLFPTLVVLDERGERLAEPLIGLANEDFYGFYLERLIEAGWGAMQARNRM